MIETGLYFKSRLDGIHVVAVHSFIHPFNRYLLHVYYVLVGMSDTRHIRHIRAFFPEECEKRFQSEVSIAKRVI